MALGFMSCGCVSLIGDQDVEMSFLVKPAGRGPFSGSTNVRLHDDVSQIDSATLVFFTLSRVDAPTGGDLTFIHRVRVEARHDSSETLVAQKIGMPSGERSVPLDIVYEDNLKSLFPDGHTIHIDWNGTADTTGLPPEGVWIKAKVRVHLE
jgi:hypothetical protein